MDGRFLIYEGFVNEAESIFKNLSAEYQLDVTDISDSGISFENSRVKLEIFYETGIQIWLKIKKYNISEMIAKLCMIKGESVYNEFKSLMFSTLDPKDLKKNNLLKLSRFLLSHFSDELSEQ